MWWHYLILGVVVYLIDPDDPLTDIVSTSGVIVTLCWSIESSWSLLGAKSKELGTTVILIVVLVDGAKLFKVIVPLSTSISPADGITVTLEPDTTL